MPAIVSKELFALAQQRLEKNKYAPSTYKADEPYLLSTKLICGDCGGTMVGESGTSGNGTKYYYYKCTTAKKKKACNRKPLRKNELEEFTFDKIVNSVFDDKVIGELAERVCAWQEKEDTTIPLLQRELLEVEKSLENVMAAIEQGIITSTTKKRMTELEAQKTDIEVKIAREEIQTQILTKEQIVFWLSNMSKLNEFPPTNQPNRT